jgi:hypothetical protein
MCVNASDHDRVQPIADHGSDLLSARFHDSAHKPPRLMSDKKKRAAQACDELIDKGAIIHRRIVGLYAPELVEFIQ